jgi:threonine/homoserine/homoserine lactone efflux protein
MEFVPFIGVAVAVVVTPGVDMALVGRNALLHGRRTGLATALGVNLGIAAWSIAAAVGVAAAVRASATVFSGLKLLGAAYLIYVGVQAWRRAGSPSGDRGGIRSPLAPRDALRQGVISNLLNPKIGLFFTALLPQFAPSDEPLLSLLALGAVFNVMGLVWLTAYAVVVARGGDLLRRPRVEAVIERLTGTVLIALGLRLAIERRPAV